MSLSSFVFGLLVLASVDTIIGFILYVMYKYLDLKYFSSLDIVTLKEENKYLREENKKINGSSSYFWGVK